jgi:4-hydroxy-3-methylbut-2-en-1-yl diphosphate reductase
VTAIFKVVDSGFCYGVKRAKKILEKAAEERSSVDCLGSLVHNERVMQQLNSKNINTVNDISEIRSPAVAISAHGVSPEVEADLKSTGCKVIDATCPSVKKVQKAARKLAEEGYWVLVYGDPHHQEVKGILGWAGVNSQATTDIQELIGLHLPKRIAILSQTTQVPENYTAFIKGLIDIFLLPDAEIHILDTICKDVRKRQVLSHDLAGKVDLMLVVGGKNSANTRRLQEICSSVTESHQISGVKEIKRGWLKGKVNIGITSGTSTSEDDIQEVIQYLKEFPAD